MLHEQPASTQIDAIDPVLASLRVRPVVVLHEWYAGQWAIEVPDRTALAGLAAVGRHDVVAVFHVVERGVAEIQRAGRRTTLEAGDVFVAVEPGPHVIRARRTRPVPIPLRQLIDGRRPARSATSDVAAPADASATRLLCGVIVVERAALSSLHGHLTVDRHLSAGRCDPASGREAELALLTAAAASGDHFRLGRLLEILVADVVDACVPVDGAEQRSDVVARAMSIIEDDPFTGWTLRSLASRCASSPSWLAESFRRRVGTPPMQYAQRRRMDAAADLLVASTLSVERVAHAAGFAHQPAFTRAFKRHFGVTPSRWREAARETSFRRGSVSSGE